MAKIMAATTQQILDYLTDIKYAQSEYMDNICKRERLGHTSLFKYRLRATILNYYVTIMVDYFYQDEGNGEYADNNFFTTDEVKDIMNRINSLCDTNFDLEL